jgi:hypothetical protein
MLDYKCYLLISSYSNASNKFVKLLGKTELVNKHKIIFVNIDSRKNRKIVTKSKLIELNKVPVLLFVYNDGTIEKYHSENLFEWLNTTPLETTTTPLETTTTPLETTTTPLETTTTTPLETTTTTPLETTTTPLETTTTPLETTTTTPLETTTTPLETTTTTPLETTTTPVKKTGAKTLMEKAMEMRQNRKLLDGN